MSDLKLFLEGAGTRDYRLLVQEHVRRQSSTRLLQASIGIAGLLPSNFVPLCEKYVDSLGIAFGQDKRFWIYSSCEEAFLKFMTVAVETFPISSSIQTLDGALHAEYSDVCFNVFQLGTLGFAYSASSQRAQRQFMGIRKGIFG